MFMYTYINKIIIFILCFFGISTRISFMFRFEQSSGYAEICLINVATHSRTKPAKPTPDNELYLEPAKHVSQSESLFCMT